MSSIWIGHRFLFSCSRPPLRAKWSKDNEIGVVPGALVSGRFLSNDSNSSRANSAARSLEVSVSSSWSFFFSDPSPTNLSIIHHCFSEQDTEFITTIISPQLLQNIDASLPSALVLHFLRAHACQYNQ